MRGRVGKDARFERICQLEGKPYLDFPLYARFVKEFGCAYQLHPVGTRCPASSVGSTAFADVQQHVPTTNLPLSQLPFPARGESRSSSMFALQSTIIRGLDWLFEPFKRIDPFWALLAVCIVTTFIFLEVFRRTTDSVRLQEAKNGMQARLLEVRLFKDSPSIVLSVPWRAC